MEIAVTLKTRKNGEIKRFIDVYYERDLKMRPEVKQVTFIFYNPIEAHDMVSVFVDNCIDFDIDLWVSLDDLNVRATQNNLYLVLCAILAKAA